MIPYGHQSIDKKDINAVMGVLKSDWLTQGPHVKKFEEALAEYCGVQYAVAVSSGTAGLHLAYLAAGLKKDDEVITTPNTFVATTNMLLTVGAKPVFCDIRSDTNNIDEKKISRLITKKTRAIVPVHFAGHPCDMDAINRIAKKHNLLVIDDACHALGARYKRRKVGSLSHMTVFSFHPVKSITTGEGGAVLTNSETYYKKLLLLRNHGLYKNEHGWNVMVTLGFNYRMTDIGASLGISQLQKLETFIAKRHEVARWYSQSFNTLEGIIIPKELKQYGSSWHLYVIRLVHAGLRDRLARFLVRSGVGVNFHYPAVYAHPYYRSHDYRNINLPNMDAYQRSCLTLPCYPGLTRAKVYAIGRHIERFIMKYR